MAIRTFALSRRLVSIIGVPLCVFPDDLPTEVDKDLIDVGPSASRCLIVGGITPGLRKGKCTSTRHRTVFLEVGLVSHNNDGNIFVVFDAGNLLAQFRELMQG